MSKNSQLVKHGGFTLVPRVRTSENMDTRLLRTNIFRGMNGQPICFCCLRLGHVAKYCRTRRNSENDRKESYVNAIAEDCTGYEKPSRKQFQVPQLIVPAMDPAEETDFFSLATKEISALRRIAADLLKLVSEKNVKDQDKIDETEEDQLERNMVSKAITDVTKDLIDIVLTQTKRKPFTSGEQPLRPEETVSKKKRQEEKFRITHEEFIT